jgi:antitoxin component YwqK of YwqJK toxin-antitoxin module
MRFLPVVLRNLPVLSKAIGCLILGLSGVACTPNQSSTSKIVELEERSDGLTYAVGSSTPYTGDYVKLAKNHTKFEQSEYKDGKLHGGVSRFFEDGQIKRRQDYVDGKRIRKRVWYANGQLKADEAWEHDHILGQCVYYFEDGRMRKLMRVGPDYAVEGHVLEFEADGSVVIDVICRQSQVINGTLKPGLEIRLGQRYASDEANSSNSSAGDQIAAVQK